MSGLDEILAALAAQRADQITAIDEAYAEINQLVRSAFEHRTTNIPEAKRLLNAALDIEHDICETLGDLAEAWGVDYETDR